MNPKKIAAAALLCAMLCLMIAELHEQCEAAGGDFGEDIMQKRGLKGIFQGKGGESSKAPNTWQKAIGIGAFFVMIAVWKWL